jgi:RNAse (barnase) inhibitor barstar
MANRVIGIDLAQINDKASLHRVFRETLGFPDYYGANWDAWIDVMTDLDSRARDLEWTPDAVRLRDGDTLTLHLEGARDFKNRCPDLFVHLVECSGFVNHSRIEAGREPILILSFYA